MVFHRDKDPAHRSMRGDEGSYLSPDNNDKMSTETQDDSKELLAADYSVTRGLGAHAIPPVVEWGPSSGKAHREQLGENESQI